MNKPRILIVVTDPATVNAFLEMHLKRLCKKYRISLAFNMKLGAVKHVFSEVEFIHIPLSRKINLLIDVLALGHLIKFLNRKSFSAVISVTPKAGFIAAIAGRLYRIPVRIHWFTGQVWATKSGLVRKFLRAIDSCIGFLVTNAFVDSFSQYEFLVENKVLSRDKGQVICSGSISGVDLDRFKSNAKFRAKIREGYSISTSDCVFIFLGRLNRDKGIFDLLQAAAKAVSFDSKIHLFVVGPDEEDVIRTARDSGLLSSNIHVIPKTEKPEDWLSVGDVFCLPSHREGFGTSVLEAAAIGLPAIGSSIYGLTDAIVHDVTGILVNPKDIDGLCAAMVNLSKKREVRKEMGNAAYCRVSEHFQTFMLVDAFDEILHSLIFINDSQG